MFVLFVPFIIIRCSVLPLTYYTVLSFSSHPLISVLSFSSHSLISVLSFSSHSLISVLNFSYHSLISVLSSRQLINVLSSRPCGHLFYVFSFLFCFLFIIVFRLLFILLTSALASSRYAEVPSVHSGFRPCRGTDTLKCEIYCLVALTVRGFDYPRKIFCVSFFRFSTF